MSAYRLDQWSMCGNMCMLFHSWLYKEATVQDVQVDADEGSAVVKVIISTAAHGRYKKLFGSRWEGRKGEIAEVKMDCTSVKEKTAFTVQYVKIYNDTNLLQCFLVKTQISQRFRCTNDPREIKGKLQMALNAQFHLFLHTPAVKTFCLRLAASPKKVG